MMAAAATPQQPAAATPQRQYDFNGWVRLDGRLDSELVGKSPYALKKILREWSVLQDAWPVTSDDYTSEVHFLCYNAMKQDHACELYVLLPRQALMAKGPRMKTVFFSCWNRLDFDDGHVEKPHRHYRNPRSKGWNHRQIDHAIDQTLEFIF